MQFRVNPFQGRRTQSYPRDLKPLHACLATIEVSSPPKPATKQPNKQTCYLASWAGHAEKTHLYLIQIQGVYIQITQYVYLLHTQYVYLLHTQYLYRLHTHSLYSSTCIYYAPSICIPVFLSTRYWPTHIIHMRGHISLLHPLPVKPT